MTELIASITSVFTAAIGWVGTTASTIAARLSCCWPVWVFPCAVWVLACSSACCLPAPNKTGGVRALAAHPRSFFLNLHFQKQR